MEHNHFQNQSTEQKNILSQDMQLHMKILQMSTMELSEYIREEFTSNPALEMDETSMGELSSIDWDKMKALAKTEENKVERSTGVASSDDYVSPFEFISKEKTLTDYLIEQIGMMNLSEEEVKVCEFIIFSLDKRGYFSDSVKESSEILGVDTAILERGLDIVRNLEPSGIGWPDIYETLLFQLKKKDLLTTNHMEIIRNHLPEVAIGNFRKIETSMGLSQEEIARIVEDIRETEPVPSRGFADNNTRSHVIPDLRIQIVGEELQITMSAMKLPKIRVSEVTRELSKEGNPELEAYLSIKLQEAMKLLKSIDMRKSTLERVTEAVMKHQKKYLLGKSAFLNPLSMKTVAEELEVHESTVSRTVREKYLCTPRGTIALKSLFSASHSSNGDELSPDYIKNLIGQIIEMEDKLHPFSDQKIAEELMKKDVEISRRTVAKYRESEGIPSTKIRKRR
ncbi:RNA polymerase factor sigma-54 [Proteiniclasticum sp. C24MP]|uniref:RNA polymerase factor sigma-54 n=1 Tax=Proteiniclasticum sp. C24MP TaxID=3374101 RepID=UPI00375458A6